jgi:FMN reductase
VAQQVAGALETTQGPVCLETLDLIRIGEGLFDSSSERLLQAKAQVDRAEVLIVASPTYKASFTGVLKSFLDHFPAPSLIGKTAFPVMTGGSLKHALAVDLQLRPVLLELGASCPGPGLYVLESEFDDLSGVVARWLDAVRATKAIRFQLNSGVRRMTEDEKFFTELETKWMAAAAARDMTNLRQMMHESFELISATSQGERVKREPWLEGLQALDMNAQHVGEMSVRRYGPVAVLNFLFTIQSQLEGKDWSRTFIMTDIWLHDGDRWRIVHRHSSYPYEGTQKFPPS